MFWTSQGELLLGLAMLVAAVILWRYLLKAFRRQPPPFFLRFDMAAQLSVVVEIALLVFGLAALIDAGVKILP